MSNTKAVCCCHLFLAAKMKFTAMAALGRFITEAPTCGPVMKCVALRVRSSKMRFSSLSRRAALVDKATWEPFLVPVRPRKLGIILAPTSSVPGFLCSHKVKSPHGSSHWQLIAVAKHEQRCHFVSLLVLVLLFCGILLLMSGLRNQLVLKMNGDC